MLKKFRIPRFKRYLISRSIAMGMACLLTAILPGASPMEPLYDLREATSLSPQVNRIDTSDPINLFPVPQSSSVGSNGLDEAITVFTFDKSRMRSKNYFKKAVVGMSPGGQYMPLLSKDTIGYGMTRGFTIFDFTHNTFRDFTIHTSIERDINKVRTADIMKNLFLFESQQDNPASSNWQDSKRVLRLLDLSGDKPVLMKNMELTDDQVWEVYGNQVFLCDFSKNNLQVLTTRLEPSHHPLEDVIHRNSGKVDFMMIVPHPNFPFAILFGGGERAQYVCWNQTFRDERPQSVFGKKASTLYYSFSPDGKWVVFLQKNAEPKRSYLMPISEKYPNYLGLPILLEGDYFDRNHFAWTDNPVSLVGSSNGKLLRYDLTKEGHPETGDKPTYWDYVVDRDLEKLRKAGKQGLQPKP